MIQKYIIDGNNLIGKISELWQLQESDRQLSRVKLVKKIDEYFGDKKVKVSIHFDGFESDKIPSTSASLTYSNKKSADSKIKSEIDSSTKPRTIAVISSDHSVQNYAKVNGCKIIKSEDFGKQMKSKRKRIDEDAIAKSISNEEIKKMFGL